MFKLIQKLSVFSFMLTFAAVAQENEQPHILSPRVGHEIDRSEREYFWLFPKISGFHSAQAFLRADSSIALRVSRQWPSVARDTTLILSPQRAEELKNFFDTFELIFNPENLQGWSLINAGLIPFPAGRKPIKEGVKIFVTRRDSNEYSGNLLFASDSLLLLDKSHAPYHWRRSRDSTFAFAPADLQRIFIPHRGNFLSGAGSGLLFGGTVGALIGLASGGDDDENGFFAFSAGTKALMGGIILGVPSALIGGVIGAGQGADDNFVISENGLNYKMFMPKLRKNASFPTLPPPELRNLDKLTDQQETIAITTATPQTTIEPVHIEQPSPLLKLLEPIGQASFKTAISKLHVGIAGGWSISGVKNDLIDAFNASGFGGTESGFFFGPIDYPISGDPNFPWHLDAAYNLSSKFRLGIAYGRVRKEETKGKDGEIQQVRGNSYRIFFEFIHRPVSTLFLTRVETAIGAGLSDLALTIASDLDASFDFSPKSKIKDNVIGGYLQGTVDYYVIKSFALQFKIAGRFMPTVSVPAQTQTYQVQYFEGGQVKFRSETKTLKSHTLNFSGVEVALGARLHF